MTDAAGATTGAEGAQGGEQTAAAAQTTTAAAGAEQAAQTTADQAQQTAAADTQQAGGAQGLDWSTVPAEFRQAFEDQHNRNHRLQQENGSARIAAKDQAREDGARQAALALAKALGADIPDGAEVTLDTVQAELGTVTTARDKATRDQAITEAAWTADVDRAKLGYLRYQLSEDTSLPAPSDPSYPAKVSEAVAALVAADPTLRRSGTVAAAGVENHGGANGNDSISAEQFAAMTLGERGQLFNTDPDAYARLSGRA